MKVNPKAFSDAEDLASPEPGENAFAFIEKYAKKRQVLLTSDSSGRIVIDANSGIKADGAVQQHGNRPRKTDDQSQKRDQRVDGGDWSGLPFRRFCPWL